VKFNPLDNLTGEPLSEKDALELALRIVDPDGSQQSLSAYFVERANIIVDSLGDFPDDVLLGFIREARDNGVSFGSLSDIDVARAYQLRSRLRNTFPLPVEAIRTWTNRRIRLFVGRPTAAEADGILELSSDEDFCIVHGDDEASFRIPSASVAAIVALPSAVKKQGCP